MIDPEECIDCDVCVAECSAEAIFPEDDLSEGQEQFIEINARLAKQWPVINVKTEPLPEAEEWNGVKGKIKYLEE